ncbi:NAD(P)-dependent oxidoreductase [Gordonia insulae]|uniref:3-hydroxyisobutyrate dehydrogenase n=1 Tax=Gordonia insulae TaxID=2420509 RepID=A0A3G8JKZ6_9ACTN|nr:NAD(P)-dependent oxidoreductase [Gordonia insulae]AZG45757.1 3-hydroxyisobutyrate dehydrogenase [Gordonia insulae]
MTDVACIGVGRMGLPIADRLVRAGHTVTAIGRTAEAREQLHTKGVRAYADIAAATTPGTEIVVVTVLTDEQVREVCLSGPLADRLSRGSTIVIHTTGSPTTVADVATVMAARGIRVVDAAVSGGPHNIAAGDLTLFVGGDVDTVDELRPLLGAYADPILHVGALGNGQRVKLVNNALFAAQIGLVRAGVELGAHLGIDESVLLAALPNGSSDSRALAGIARRGSVDSFAEAVGEFVGKDLAVVRSVAAELGGDLGPLEALLTESVRP